MKINGPPPPPTLTTSLSQLQQLRLGQLLQAVVIKQIASHTVLLQLLGGTPQKSPLTPPLLLKADTPQPLVTGQRLQLEVIQLGEKPLLKVLGQAPVTDSTTNQTLLQALPRQTSMTPLLANLSWLNQQGATTPIPQAILVLAKELLDKLPSREKISSVDGLKQALKDSGLFLENRLAQAAKQGRAPDTSTDLKSLLLRLLSAVQKESAQSAPQGSATTTRAPLTAAMPLITQVPIPPIPGGRPQPQRQSEATLATLSNTLSLLQELGKQSEGSVARTQLHQLASLMSNDQNPLTWSFELPVRNQTQIDLFQFVVQEQKDEHDESDEQKRRWSITIAFELKGLGPMYTRLQLENGKISTTFWADSFDTTNLITHNLPELAQRYHHAGLESSELRCFQGQPPESNTTIPRVVLDIKA